VFRLQNIVAWAELVKMKAITFVRREGYYCNCTVSGCILLLCNVQWGKCFELCVLTLSLVLSLFRSCHLYKDTFHCFQHSH